MENKIRESRDELIELVRKIQLAEGTEEEIDRWLGDLEAAVPHPDVSDLIFYPERDMSAEEIVDLAVSYKPRAR